MHRVIYQVEQNLILLKIGIARYQHLSDMFDLCFVRTFESYVIITIEFNYRNNEKKKRKIDCKNT